MCVCVVSVIVKHPMLPLCGVDGCSRNPLYYYYCARNLQKPYKCFWMKEVTKIKRRKKKAVEPNKPNKNKSATTKNNNKIFPSLQSKWKKVNNQTKLKQQQKIPTN